METERCQIEHIDETSQAIFCDQVIQPVREECRLIPADTLDETRHAKRLVQGGTAGGAKAGT